MASSGRGGGKHIKTHGIRLPPHNVYTRVYLMGFLYVCMYVGSDVVGCMTRTNAILWSHPTRYDIHKPHNVALAGMCVVCL